MQLLLIGLSRSSKVQAKTYRNSYCSNYLYIKHTYLMMFYSNLHKMYSKLNKSICLKKGHPFNSSYFEEKPAIKCHLWRSKLGHL